MPELRRRRLDGVGRVGFRGRYSGRRFGCSSFKFFGGGGRMHYGWGRRISLSTYGACLVRGGLGSDVPRNAGRWLGRFGVGGRICLGRDFLCRSQERDQGLGEPYHLFAVGIELVLKDAKHFRVILPKLFMQ